MIKTFALFCVQSQVETIIYTSRVLFQGCSRKGMFLVCFSLFLDCMFLGQGLSARGLSESTNGPNTSQETALTLVFSQENFILVAKVYCPPQVTLLLLRTVFNCSKDYLLILIPALDAETAMRWMGSSGLTWAQSNVDKTVNEQHHCRTKKSLLKNVAWPRYHGTKTF